MYLNLDKDKLLKLSEYGLNIDGNMRNVFSDFVCEIPCGLKTAEIGPCVDIGAFTYIVSGYLFAVKIGRYCSVAENVQIGRQNHPIDWISTSPYFYLPSDQIQPLGNRNRDFFRTEFYQHNAPATSMQHTKLGHDVWVGHAAYIKAGVNIGNGAIIAAESVVTKDVEPYAIVGGNPAKFIRYRIPEELISALEETEWWKYTPKQLEKFQMHDIKAFIEEFSAEDLIEPEIEKIYLKSFNFETDA